MSKSDTTPDEMLVDATIAIRAVETALEDCRQVLCRVWEADQSRHEARLREFGERGIERQQFTRSNLDRARDALEPYRRLIEYFDSADEID